MSARVLLEALVKETKGVQATLLAQPPFRLSLAATAKMSEAARADLTTRFLTEPGANFRRSSVQPSFVTQRRAERGTQPIAPSALSMTWAGETTYENGAAGGISVFAAFQMSSSMLCESVACQMIVAHVSAVFAAYKT